jgi:hypothetical protein
MTEPDPHLYHLVTHRDKGGRAWIYGLVIFCTLLLVGSVWYVIGRMPEMLCGSIQTARRVDITSNATKTPVVFTSPVHREALAKVVAAHDFRFSMGDTWRAYRGDVPRDSAKETMVLEIVASDNRNTPVELLGGELLLTGKFAFRAAHPADLGPEVVTIAKMKK